LCTTLCAADKFHGGAELDPAQKARTASDLELTEQTFLQAIRTPMRDGMDVEKALAAWLQVRCAEGEMLPDDAIKILMDGMATIADAKPLPKAQWPVNPTDVAFQLHETVKLATFDDIECRIVEFEVDDLTQYGVVFTPRREGEFPLILYLHGAAFGVPVYSMPWLAELSRTGYVVVAPALRGEDLFTQRLRNQPEYVCEGKIENLDGEVNDALAMVDGAFKLPAVKPGKFAVVGHSFGSGVGLLVTARAGDQVAVTISYDAWFTNPFRYYWDRMRRGANNWLSWEEYLELPSAEQLPGLMRRSVVHNTAGIQAPMLLFIGGRYAGSVFHDTHEHLVDQLKAGGKTYVYDVVPGGGHNFVLYEDSEPAKYAYGVQMEWLQKYHAANPAPEPANPE
jgi:dienelactone hydrolase